ELSTFHNTSWLGSEFKYERYLLDLRKYYKFNDKNVVAVQAMGVFNPGDVPFREMARLGGQYMMRGYYDGRYRDKNLLAFQAEYRRHLFWRLGVVGFAAVGDVASAPKNFDAGEFKLTGGAGLRINVKEKDRVNIRIDYGVGNNSSGLYFGIGEVF
ncbi:MAG: hypothetical protein LPK19_12940, partial [Hymenobacteraceae bacterium]|nr:hypothetical protein [Hymenobacteraceae bacterium]MDX5397128.1 hypothetical protein [Hymenobacteraceae bacterium]MDX5513206.1 hypothetical protein [Hymenobacteraceae bacterium]